jgi:hypothetical protein
MPAGIKCSICGTEAEERGLYHEDMWDDPHCPRCDKPLTPEGLLLQEIELNGVRMMQELGKGGAVIWEYQADPATGDRPTQDDAERFLRQILQLEEESRNFASGPVSIAQGQSKWNKKAATRRFRRWFHSEYGNRPLEISQPTLRELAVRVLKDDPGYTPLRDEIENEQKYFGERLADYRIRASSEEPLIVSRLSPAARLMIVEAQDAFRFGLFRAVFAICRALLEDVIRDVVSRLPHAPDPIDDTNLQVLIGCLPNSMLPLRARSLAHEVRENGNSAVHDASRAFDIVAAWRNLRVTAQLVQLLLERSDAYG